MSLNSQCYYTSDIMDLIEHNVKYFVPITYSSFVLTMVIFVVGLIGNGIVIVFHIFVMKKHKSRIWFLNLAITDFVSLLFLPLFGFSILQGHWPYGKHVCKMFLFVTCVNMYASIFILIGLNLSRALSVVKPMFHQVFVSQRVSRWTCITIWTITIFTSFPVLVFSGEFKIGDDSHCSLFCSKDDVDIAFDSVVNVTEPLSLEEKIYLDAYSKLHYFYRECSPEKCCSDENTIKIWNHIRFSMQSFTIPLLVIGYFLPFCVIVFSNITIAVQVRKSQTINTHRLNQIVITIIIMYFITWTPLIVGELVILAAASDMNFILMFKVFTFMPLLCCIAYINCFLNPIMYVLVGRQARTGLTEFLSSLSTRSN